MDNTEKQCAQCGTLNPVSANFCKTCGSNNFIFAEPVGVDKENSNSEADINCIENPVNEQHTKVNKPKEFNLVKAFLSGIAGILAIIIAVVVIEKIPPKAPVDNDSDIENVVSELTSTTPSKIKKTVMIYLVGSDLESQSGAASMDIVEMMESGVDTSKNNILVYTGGTKQWFIEDIPATQNSIYKLENGEFSLVKSLESLNMGDSSTLAEFLNYGVTNHSADSYGLILWNHGAGPMIGYGVDEVHGDLLEMSEITNALSRAGFGNELKLEFLGFDACLMGSIETAWTIKDYAEFLIASQETEPGTGWDYAFLEKLNYYDEGNHIGQAIIDSYFSGYEEIVSQYPQFEADLTLSCMDLSKIEDVEDGLNLLFKQVDSNILSGSFQQTSKCRYETKAFGKFASTFNYDLIDLTHITSLLSSDYKEESKKLSHALKDFIVYSKANVENASGVSIYHPYDNKEYMELWTNTFDSFGFASEYAKYISNFGSILTGETISSWEGFNKTVGSSKKDDDGNELSIQLTDEQASNYAGSAYYIVKKMKDDEYLFVFGGVDAKLDKNGVLSASYNDKAVFGVNDSNNEVSDIPITMYQVNDGSDELKYFATSIFFDNESIDMSEWKTEAVEWQIKIDEGVPKLLGAMPIEDDNTVPNKQLLNYKDYTYVQFVFSARKPTYDKAGKLLPYFEWESEGMFYGTEYYVDDGFHLECRDIEDKDEYYAMFVVKDTQGNKYTSELFTLDK